MPGILEVFYRAAEDLEERRGRPPQPRNPAPLESHVRHLLSTDPATSMVADDAGRVVAFGIAPVRDSTWFLSFLFVAPEWQAHGLGRAVFDACLAEAGAIGRRATCAEANQPVSTGLYASLGMSPLLPIYVLRGVLHGETLPALSSDTRARNLDAADIVAIDDVLLGYQRPQDHAFWAQQDRRGWVFESSRGEVLGYGYAQPSGRIGPVAAVDPVQLLPFVGHLVRSTQVLEGWQVVIPGPAIDALQPLLQAGLRIDGTPAVYCSDAAAPQLDRYLPGSFALL